MAFSIKMYPIKSKFFNSNYSIWIIRLVPNVFDFITAY